MKYKKIIGTLLATIFFFQIAQLQVFAAPKSSPITIDGNFSDWKNMPYVSDRKGDVPNGMNHEDITGVKYYSDREYLYLYVERQSAGHHLDGWTFHVVFPGAKTGGQDKWESVEIDGKCQMIQYRFPIIWVGPVGKGNQHAVEVTAGSYKEQTLSVSKNKKEIEFRVPLKEFGLDKQKEILFALKSNLGGAVCPAKDTIDWVPDREGWIHIDNGPTLWQFSAIAGFGIVGFAAYRIVRSKKKGKN